MRGKMVKLWAQTVEILSWHVGGLNSGLFPLIFVPITTFFIGEIFYSVLLEIAWRLSGVWHCKFMLEPRKAHIFLNLLFCHLVVVSLNLCYFYFLCCWNLSCIFNIIDVFFIVYILNISFSHLNICLIHSLEIPVCLLGK